MTATLQYNAKSSLQSPHNNNRMPLKRSRSGAQKPSVPVGKLMNIRNFYARRRPSMLPVIKRVVSPAPERWSRVRFDDDVSVYSIPSRKDYSMEEKEEIWMPRSELRQLIQKNHVEFVYEGRDWRNAPEEDEFGTDESGELLHPAVVAEKAARLVQMAHYQKQRPRLWRRKLPLSQVTEPQCKRFRLCNDSEEMDL